MNITTRGTIKNLKYSNSGYLIYLALYLLDKFEKKLLLPLVFKKVTEVHKISHYYIKIYTALVIQLQFIFSGVRLFLLLDWFNSLRINKRKHGLRNFIHIFC